MLLANRITVRTHRRDVTEIENLRAEIEGLDKLLQISNDTELKLKDEIWKMHTEKKHLASDIDRMLERCNSDMATIRKCASMMLANGISHRAVYETVCDSLDREGWTLHMTAKKLTGIDVCEYFYAEDNMGRFEQANGHALVRWIALAAFGDIEYELSGCYEIVSSFSLDESQAQYQDFCAQLYKQTLHSILGLDA